MGLLSKKKPEQEAAEPPPTQTRRFERSVSVSGGVASICITRIRPAGAYPSVDHLWPSYSGDISGAREFRDTLTAAIEIAQRLEGACAAAMVGQK